MSTLPRLLVIDDEPMLTDAIRRMLLADAEVTACASVDEATARLARGEQFDAVLCDLHLVGRGGKELFEELTRTNPALARRTGFVTGGAIDDAGQAFIRAHADRVLDKPFTRASLRAIVQSLAGNR